MRPEHQRTLLFAGGGTGGHVYPGLALAAEVLARGGWSAHWIGTRGRIEERAVPRAGIPIEYLDVPFLKGVRGVKLATSVARLPVVGVRAMQLVRRIRPAAVVGLGGFVSGPVAAAAWSMGIPVFLLEQNAQPGITNRQLARIATRIYASFGASAVFFPAGRTRVLGNPVRAEVLAASSQRVPAPDDAIRVLVFGGSQGARSINENVPGILAAVARSGTPLRIRHAAGTGNAEAVAGRYLRESLKAEVSDYIDDMAAAYAATDFAVCRAGATTIAELTAFGLPALYVPFPFAADDHQTSNARAVVEQGGGVMVADSELTSPRPSRLLTELFRHREVLERMGRSARTLGRPDSTRDIADDLLAALEASP